MMNPLRGFGVDLSIRATGVAWIDETGTIQTRTLHRQSTDGTPAARASRRRSIVNEILDLALAARAECVLIEGPFVMRQTPDEIDKLALHGVLVDDLASARIPFGYISPSSLKFFATGEGATKAGMIAAARQYLGLTGYDDNQADAAHALAALRFALGCPLAEYTDAQLSYLDVVAWPSNVAAPVVPARVKKKAKKKAASTGRLAA